MRVFRKGAVFAWRCFRPRLPRRRRRVPPRTVARERAERVRDGACRAPPPFALLLLSARYAASSSSCGDDAGHMTRSYRRNIVLSVHTASSSPRAFWRGEASRRRPEGGRDLRGGGGSSRDGLTARRRFEERRRARCLGQRSAIDHASACKSKGLIRVTQTRNHSKRLKPPPARRVERGRAHPIRLPRRRPPSVQRSALLSELFSSARL